jgi:hypothetical protein
MLNSLNLPAPEAGDFLELILLHAPVRVKKPGNWNQVLLMYLQKRNIFGLEISFGCHSIDGEPMKCRVMTDYDKHSFDMSYKLTHPLFFHSFSFQKPFSAIELHCARCDVQR